MNCCFRIFYTNIYICNYLYFERTNLNLSEKRREILSRMQIAEKYLKRKFIFLFVSKRKGLIHNFFQVLLYKFHSQRKLPLHFIPRGVCERIIPAKQHMEERKIKHL